MAVETKMKRSCFLFLGVVMLFCPALVECEVSKYSQPRHYGMDIGYDFLHAYRTALRNGLRGVSEARGLGITPECLIDVAKLLNKNDTELLMQYVDAVGKPRSGYLRGNVLWLGSFSECQDIPNAHYCSANLAISSPEIKDPKSEHLFALWGLCFPKSCVTQDVALSLKFILEKVEAFAKDNISIQYSKVNCPAESATYTTGVKVTLVLCGVLLFLCFVGTAVDALDETFAISTMPAASNISSMATDQDEVSIAKIATNGSDVTDHLVVDDIVLLNHSKFSVKIHYIVATFKGIAPGKFFQCFSLLRNTAKIFKTDVTPSAIKSINGIRVMSITWVILGHTFLFFGTGIVENKLGAVKDGQLLSMMAVLSGTYSVDSFFFLSGLLVAYTCFRKLKNNDGKFSWVLFYVHRFWRLTPSYMFVILFSIHLKGFLTESPFWYTQYTDPLCSKYWWTNLLYINNFYPKSDKMCIGWSWYLANDMQFFVITPFLILPLFKVGWRGLVLPLGLLLEASIITAFIHAHWNLDPLGLLKVYRWLVTPMANNENLREYMTYVYFKPYCRIQVYLVGFLLGYIMHRYSNRRSRTPNWITTLLGWSIAVVVGMLLVYGPHKSILPGAEKWNKTENVMFGTFHRFLWGLVLAWVTYACHYGAGGLVHKFLSAKFWIPLSRMSYNVYLIHYIILILMFIGPQGIIHYDMYTAVYYFLAAVMLSFGAAYVLCVVIELPCANLEELILQYVRKAYKRKAGN